MAEILVDFNKLQESASLIDNEVKHLRELFEKQDSNFELLKDNKLWNGSSNEKCISKYNELKGKYEDILNNLDSYRQFLLKVGEAYKDINDKAGKVAFEMQ